jgi:energy-coupling factor transporter ATP-binding protein EcfA2
MSAEQPEPVSARFWISSATFSDGTTLQFTKDQKVVLVGPNNAGKSAALRAIREKLENSKNGSPVIKQIAIGRQGDSSSIRKWLAPYKYTDGPHQWYRLYQHRMHVTSLENATANAKTALGELAGFFCQFLNTDAKLEASKPPETIAIARESPAHPIHNLLRDEDLEQKISVLFKRAFGVELIVHRNAGTRVPLHCGARPPVNTPIEDRASPSYVRKLEELPTLYEQGDGMRSYAGVLLYAFTAPQSIVLIDEPEAFLHPPQAKLLGRSLLSDQTSEKQIFIATHSGDVLRGILDANSQTTRIVRIRRQGNVNVVAELNATQIAEVWKDPLLRYSNILDGIFHEQVAVCEGDSDCRFYGAIFEEVVALRGDGFRRPDIMFTHAGGKQRLPMLVRALRQLAVPVRAITDLDILSDVQPLKNLLEAAGGDWSTFEADWKLVKIAVDSKKSELSAADARRGINEILDKIEGQAVSLAVNSKIKDVLRRTSPWSLLKQGGSTFIPSGDPTQAYARLRSGLRSLGIFMVDVGELEGYCRSVGCDGPAWVNTVLEKDLSKDPELNEARQFVTEVFLD